MKIELEYRGKEVLLVYEIGSIIINWDGVNSDSEANYTSSIGFDDDELDGLRW